MLMRATSPSVASKSPAKSLKSSAKSPTWPPAGPDPIVLMGAATAFGRNAEIYGEGQPADHLYKVVSGTVRTAKILSDGRRQIGAFYLPGDMFGFDHGAERAFSAEAIGEASILVIERATLIALAVHDTTVARELWTLTARELARVQRHVLLLVKTAQARVSGFLLEMAERGAAGDTLALPMLRQDIADYLGLTIETVSRTLSGLEADGMIELIGSRGVVLRKPALLGRLAA
jgi:CRP/FNR family nitrogen fixation transcriptional regulator